MKRLTKDTFLELARIVHGERYDYTNSLEKYINRNSKIDIVCRLHGKFPQKPGKHIHRKQGCPVCSGKIKITEEEFIKRSRKVHGNKYLYLNFLGLETKVDIICLKHGKFGQWPRDHYNGHGCKKCGIEFNIENQSYTQSEVIDMARKVHEDRYCYYLVEYINMKTDVKIICESHGVFNQTFDAHIHQKQGCPNCLYKNETTVGVVLNFLDIKYKRRLYVKINDKRRYIDYYLPEYNMFIEYNGRQHYEAVKYSRNWTDDYAKNELINRQKRDKDIQYYCKNNNINLWEIDGRKYFNQNLVDLIKNHFNEK